jgi:hypothetical protein
MSGSLPGVMRRRMPERVGIVSARPRGIALRERQPAVKDCGCRRHFLAVSADYRELKTGLGLDHFEGRSYLGWHRHVTLAVLAQAFITMIRTDPKAHAPG